MGGIALILTFTFAGGLAAQEPAVGRYEQKVNVIDAVYLPKIAKVIYINHMGTVGSIQVEGDAATAQEITRKPDEDFTSLQKLSNGEVLIGSAQGMLCRFDGEAVTEVAQLSEFQVPILSISVSGNSYWATGARGLLAKSTDGKKWDLMEAGHVKQPPMPLPTGETGTRYFGVANIVSETVVVTGTVGGKPAVADQDYMIYPDDGTIEITNPFDEMSAPSIAFDFQPGPPYRAGDVSWNVVLQENGRITIAGEFGYIFQSDDGGQSWVRRNGRLSKSEAAQLYWMSGYTSGNKIALGGAAGLVGISDDKGENWVQLERPGRDGVFGVRFVDGDKLFISGAVGLAGRFKDDRWDLVDRSATNLYSWLKTFVQLEDGSLLLLGGNSTALSYKNDMWERLQMTVKQ
ncbi:MAG: hypothetical protein HQ511_07250 [Rhodospirillales bacterium]|nr:hypothetical protein [Rhodospirillales bacterium]